MKLFNFILLLWFIFALLDPDPLTRLNPDPIRIRNPSSNRVRLSPHAASRGSRDLFPLGWCACNQIPLIGRHQPLHTPATEEAENSSHQPLDSYSSSSSSCAVEETAAVSLERPLADIPGPKASLTGQIVVFT
jgi:hypothetical protein